MKIWVFNHYASTPDQPTTGSYFIMKALADRGHEVTAFADSFSYYLRKEIRLKGKWFTRFEDHDGVGFQWVRTTPTSGRALTRLINMLSFMIMSFFIGIFRRGGRPDYVIGVSPHPFAAFSAWLVSVFRRGKFIYEVRDIWPESLVDSGMIKRGGFMDKFFTIFQKFLYKRAFKVISVLPAVGDYLETMGVGKDKFLWVPNGMIIDQANLTEPLARPVNDNQPFVVMYLGGHSKYQGIDVIIDAAKIVQDQGKTGVRFVCIGDGSEKPQLLKYAKDQGVTNIEFRDPVPRAEVKNITGEADCFLYHLKHMPILRFGISPNKLCDYMFSARPIISAVDAYNNPVTDARAGLAIKPDDAKAMAQAVLDMVALSQEERAEMAKNAQAYALENYDVARLAEKMETALSKTP